MPVNSKASPAKASSSIALNRCVATDEARYSSMVLMSDSGRVRVHGRDHITHGRNYAVRPPRSFSGKPPSIRIYLRGRYVVRRQVFYIQAAALHIANNANNFPRLRLSCIGNARRKVLATTSSLGKYLRAKASFTITTPGALLSSRSLKFTSAQQRNIKVLKIPAKRSQCPRRVFPT